jgi:hypothetical protein
MKYYKFTKYGRYGTRQSGYRYPPPGKWTDPVCPRLCKSGFHVCKAGHLLVWGDECLWEVEGKGEVQHGRNKSAFEQIRFVRGINNWNPFVLRTYAADVAQDVLPIFEAQFPKDYRPRKAIQAARDYANGLISKDILRNAAVAARHSSDRYMPRTTRSLMCAARASYYAAYFDDYWNAAANAVDAAVEVVSTGVFSTEIDNVRAATIVAREKYHKWLLERLGIGRNGEVSE